MELRKCCNHAYLFDSAIPPAPTKEADHALLTGASGKLLFLSQVASLSLSRNPAGCAQAQSRYKPIVRS